MLTHQRPVDMVPLLIPSSHEFGTPKDTVAVYTDPVSNALKWRQVEALPVAIGYRVIEGKGSSVRFEKWACTRRDGRRSAG